MGIFSKLKQAWFGYVNWEKLDDEFFDNLEESLILADVGVNIAAESVNSLRNAVFSYDMKDPEQVKLVLKMVATWFSLTNSKTMNLNSNGK